MFIKIQIKLMSKNTSQEAAATVQGSSTHWPSKSAPSWNVVVAGEGSQVRIQNRYEGSLIRTRQDGNIGCVILGPLTASSSPILTSQVVPSSLRCVSLPSSPINQYRRRRCKPISATGHSFFTLVVFFNPLCFSSYIRQNAWHNKRGKSNARDYYRAVHEGPTFSGGFSEWLVWPSLRLLLREMLST